MACMSTFQAFVSYHHDDHDSESEFVCHPLLQVAALDKQSSKIGTALGAPFEKW